MYHSLRLVLLALPLTAACGEEPTSKEQDARDACEIAYTKLCDRACACTAGDACDLTDGKGTVVSSDDRDECLRLIDLFCNSAEGRPPDVDVCTADIDAAACQTQEDGDQALLKPTSCDPQE